MCGGGWVGACVFVLFVWWLSNHMCQTCVCVICFLPNYMCQPYKCVIYCPVICVDLICVSLVCLLLNHMCRPHVCVICLLFSHVCQPQRHCFHASHSGIPTSNITRDLCCIMALPPNVNKGRRHIVGGLSSKAE